jgi:hypothetical protein
MKVSVASPELISAGDIVDIFPSIRDHRPQKQSISKEINCAKHEYEET